MSRTSTLIFLGILTILAPFSGFPIAFRNLLTVIFGACVVGIGFALRTNETKNAAAERPSADISPASEPWPPQDISPI
ncbi:MAG TPA: hypothetical protein VNF51_00695 [Candidatus Paceibacterota bacterium]|nr:hypothetical protein [Candidatus Paceibacterota bacterium]